MFTLTEQDIKDIIEEAEELIVGVDVEYPVVECAINAITDLSLTNYLNIIANCEALGLPYQQIKRVIRAVYMAHSSKLAKTMLAHEHKFSYKENEALTAYVCEAYQEINDSLLGFIDTNNEIDEAVKTLDEAFENHAIKFSGKLFRSMEMELPHVLALKNIGTFKFNNFVSTSYCAGHVFGAWNTNCTALGCEKSYIRERKEQPSRYSANVCFIMDCENVDALNLVPNSWNPEEAEILLPRGTCIEIENVVESLGNEQNRQFAIYCKVI